jgi:hypothetical protein
VKVRFDLVDKNNGTLWDNYAWFIDDIKITKALSEYDPPQLALASTNPAGVVYGLNVPNIDATISDASGMDTVMLIYSKNNSADDTVPMYDYGNHFYRGFIDTTNNPIQVGDIFCYRVYARDASAYNLTTTAPTSCQQFSIAALSTPTCGTTISSFPYTQDFSSFTNGLQYCATVPVPALAAGWVNASGTDDDNEWVPEATIYGPSSGPVNDHTTGSYGGKQLIFRHCPNKTAIVTTPCFDLTSLSIPNAEFWYYMNQNYQTIGNGVGTLKLEVFYGGSWQTVWSKTGMQGTGWNKAEVDLSSFQGVVKMRFVGASAPSGGSPFMSIDDFSVKEGGQNIDDIGITAITKPVNGQSNPADSIMVSLKNFANNYIYFPRVAYSVNGTVIDTVTCNFPLPNGFEAGVFLGTYNFNVGANLIEAWSVMPNGVTDSNTSNDTASTVITVCNGSLSGTYTIDPAQAVSATNFHTVEDIVTSLKYCGISGPVQIQLANGHHTISNLVIDNISGLSSSNWITFESVSGNRDDVTVEVLGGSDYGFKLDLADYILFQNLTFQAQQTGSKGIIFTLSDNNDFIHFKNNRFLGSKTLSSSSSYAHIFLEEFSVVKDLLIENNIFKYGSKGIYSDAWMGSNSQSITIHNNLFDSVNYRAMDINYADTLIATNNVITGKASASQYAYRIYASDCYYVNIQNNVINGKSHSIYLAYCVSSQTEPSIVANNMMLLHGTSDNTRALFLKGSEYVHCFHNTVRNTSSSASSYALCLQGTDNITIKNNIFQNEGAGFVAYFKGTNTNTVMDYNAMHAQSGNIVKHGTTPYTTLSAWTTASTLDANSIYANVVFNGTDDLHTADLDVMAAGTAIASITTDIDGETRSTTAPCIGADEFTLHNNDIGVTQILRPIAIDSAGMTVPVEVCVKNFGINSVSSFDVSYRLNGGTAVVTTISQSLSSNQTDTFNLTNLTLPFGIHELEVYTSLSGDGDLNNDTTKLNYQGISSDDVEVVEVYALGSLPKESGLPYSAQALIQNNTYQDLLNVPVYLTLSGTNTWSDTVYVDTLKVGTQELVSFDAYAPSTLGVDTVKAFVAADDLVSNNKITKLQSLTSEHFNYAYGTVADSDLDVNEQAVFAKYVVQGSKVVDEVSVFISSNAVVGDTIYAVVLDSNESILATSDSLILTSSHLGTYQVIDVYDSTAVLVNTGFYVGIAALNNSTDLIGVQNESPVRSDAFFQSNDLSVSNLTDMQSSLSGMLMIGANMVNPPAYDITASSFVLPLDGCGLANETVTIELVNSGQDTLVETFPVSYQVKGGITVSETVSVNLLPGASSQYSFTTPVDLSVTQDSTFELRAWTDFNNDANANNDTTAWYAIVSTYKPALPTVTDDVVNYGDGATLSATTNTAFQLYWYDADVNGALLDSGITLTLNTPFFDTTSYYVEASNNGCKSDLAEVEVIVINIPQNEVELTQIVNPSNSVLPHVASNIEVDITNKGLVDLSNVNIHWAINGVIQTPYPWTGTLGIKGTTQVNIGSYTPNGGVYELKVWTSSPNGVVDLYPDNDTLSTIFTSSLAGVYTIGDTTGGLNYDFSSIDNAVTAINQAGVSAAVTFQIASGVYTVDTLEIAAIAGASATQMVQFVSATGNKNDVVINTTEEYIFKLEDAHFVEFKYLSFATNATGDYQRLFFLNNSNSVSYIDCRLTGSTNTSGGYKKSIIFAEDTGIDSIYFDSCEFNNGVYGLYLSSSIDTVHKSVHFSNTTFNNVDGWCAYVSTVQNAYFHNNVVNGDGNSTDGFTVYGADNINITNNKLMDVDNGIVISTAYGSASNPLLIANNMIKGTNNGIKVSYDVEFAHVLHNTVVVDGNQSTQTYGNAFYLSGTNAISTKVMNNIFVQEGSRNIMYISGVVNYSAIINYNNYYTADTAKFVRINNVTYADFAAYQAAYPADSNSVSVNPNFTNTNDLHIVDPMLNDLGTPTYSMLSDIDGEVRSTTNPDMGADEFSISPIDLAVLSFQNVDLISSAGANLSVSVEVVNYGSNTLSSFPLGYQYNGVTVLDTVTQTLAPMQHYTYTFATPLLVGSNIKELKAFAHVPSDGNQLNDTITTDINGVIITTPNYSTDFETSNDFVVMKSSSVWEYGTPTATFINSAYSPSNAWVTSLSGIVNPQGDHSLYSPYFELDNTMDTILINFMKIHDLGTNTVMLEMKNGKNGTWSAVGYMTDPSGTNWYNSANAGVHAWSGATSGWEEAEYRFSTAALGVKDTIQFRFRYTGVTSVNEGFAIDNFSIKYQMDAGLTNLLFPVSDTLPGSQIYAQVEIENFGETDINSIPLELSIDGIQVVTETANVTLAPGASTTFTFTQAFTVPNHNYELCIENVMLGDGIEANNMLCDSLEVTQLPSDVALISIVSPVDNNGQICVNQSYYEYDVEVEIQNLGDDTIHLLDLSYTENGSNAVQEQWTGSLLPGATTTYTFTQKWQPVQTGNLELCVEASLVDDVDLSNNEVCKSYTGDLCAGIEDATGDQMVVLRSRPNPTTGLTTVDYYLPQAGAVTFQLYNQFGQLIMVEQISETQGEHSLEIDLSAYADGVYYCTTQYLNQIYTHKLVLRK